MKIKSSKNIDAANTRLYVDTDRLNKAYSINFSDPSSMYELLEDLGGYDFANQFTTAMREYISSMEDITDCIDEIEINLDRLNMEISDLEAVSDTIDNPNARDEILRLYEFTKSVVSECMEYIKTIDSIIEENQ